MEDETCEQSANPNPSARVHARNNFFLPYVVLPDSAQYPVEVGLSDLLVSASRPMVALAALFAALPVAVVFLVSQRALARGLIRDAAGS